MSSFSYVTWIIDENSEGEDRTQSAFFTIRLFSNLESFQTHRIHLFPTSDLAPIQLPTSTPFEVYLQPFQGLDEDGEAEMVTTTT